MGFATGLIKSAKEGNWSSRVMKEGLLKKAIELTALFAVLLIQRVCNNQWNYCAIYIFL